MQLSDIMSSNVEVVPPDATLQDAASKMKELDVGALPVCDGRRLMGMVTDRDIAIRAVAEGRDPRSTRVRDAMSPQVVYCYNDEDVREAARIMEQKQIRRLPVLDRAQHLVGIVSLGDLATQAGSDKLSGEALEQISQPSGASSRMQ